MLTDTTRSPYAKVHALDGMKVKWTGGLWKERFDTCANSTVPQLKHMFDSKDISHVVENFKICAGLEREAETAFPEWEILSISRYTTSDICLQRPVYIKELQVRTAFLQLQPERQIIWNTCMKRQSAQEKYRLQSALPTIWDLWKCTVLLAKRVI